MKRPKLRVRGALALMLGILACATSQAPNSIAPSLVSTQGNALATYDALEVLIDQGSDTPADREFAYASVQRDPDGGGPETPFARAAVTGRLIQQKGLLAAGLVSDVERNAELSRSRDPEFREGAATRILGTLYVLAPASLLSHGNSEVGIELLEGLVTEHPDSLPDHLRLAEGYLALGDTKPALPHLCLCLARKEELRPSDRALLEQLVAGGGMPACFEGSPQAFEGNRSRAPRRGFLHLFTGRRNPLQACISSERRGLSAGSQALSLHRALDHSSNLL
jgi:hypothetical protein